LTKIRNIELGERPVLLAPMEDVTDVSFRLVSRRMGADAVYTEFISSEALIRAAAKSMRKMVTLPEERPVAIQIFGGDPEVMREAAQISEEAGPDFIDINCGCWVKGVTGKGAGAGLLKDPLRMEQMVRATSDAVKLPVTVKTRLGWDHESINILNIAPMLEQAGAAAITIHCRTRSMGHSGEADWSWIPRIKERVGIPVFLNGDVRTPEDAERAFKETGCDAVMVGRAAINNPFVFKQIKDYFATGVYRDPSVEERFKLCVDHLEMSIASKGELRAILEFRKYYAGYLKGLFGVSKLRQELMRITEREAAFAAILAFRDRYLSEFGDLVDEQIAQAA
jgi:tRNA-dihydrouridine synthase B